MVLEDGVNKRRFVFHRRGRTARRSFHTSVSCALDEWLVDRRHENRVDKFATRL